MPKITVMSFTDLRIKKIKPPREGTDRYKDKKEKGFILLVGKGGSKVFYLYKNINNKPRHIKIGNFPYLSVEEAKARVFDLKNEIAHGNDPSIKSQQEEVKDLTFQELYDKYMNEHVVYNVKPSSVINITSPINKHASHIYQQRLSNLTTEWMQDLHIKVSKKGKYAANRLIGVLSTIFNNEMGHVG